MIIILVLTTISCGNDSASDSYDSGNELFKQGECNEAINAKQAINANPKHYNAFNNWAVPWKN